MENLVNVLIVVIPLQTILYVVFLWSFFMFNIQDTKTTSITYKDFPVESPSQFSALRTAKYGMLSLLSIFMLNVPVVVSTAQVY